MKRTFLLSTFLLGFIFISLAQDDLSKVNVQLKNDKVFLTDTIDIQLNKDGWYQRLMDWLPTFISERGQIGSENEEIGLISVHMTDYLEIEKKSFSMFAMYIRYNLFFQFDANKCVVIVRDINYIEQDKYESGKYSRDDLISAKTILIDKKYKPIFVKNASERISEHTIELFEQIFGQIEDVLK